MWCRCFSSHRHSELNLILWRKRSHIVPTLEHAFLFILYFHQLGIRTIGMPLSFQHRQHEEIPWFIARTLGCSTTPQALAFYICSLLFEQRCSECFSYLIFTSFTAAQKHKPNKMVTLQKSKISHINLPEKISKPLTGFLTAAAAVSLTCMLT